jgi:hypothetical protein
MTARASPSSTETGTFSLSIPVTRLMNKDSLRTFFATVCASLLLYFATLDHLAHSESSRRGCEVTVYWDPSYSGEVWRTTEDQASAGSHWTKQISSIIVISGIWDFYWDANYRGEVITLPPGGYPYIGDHWNDKINSFRCVRATQ